MSRAKSSAAEIAAIEDLMGDLEKRLRRLSGATKKEAVGATNDVSEFVSEALNDIMDRVRDGATNDTQSAVDQAGRIRFDAFKKIAGGIEEWPLIMLAIAAGIGFIFGMTQRR